MKFLVLKTGFTILYQRSKWQNRQNQTPAECRASMTWSQRLKWVFDIDVETCSECGCDVKIITSIDNPAVIKKILVHLDGKCSDRPRVCENSTHPRPVAAMGDCTK